MTGPEYCGTIDAITYTLTSDIKKTIKQLKERGIVPSQEDREVDSIELTKTIIYTGMLVEPTQEQIAVLNELDIGFIVVEFKGGGLKISKIYEDAVELRELLNKIPDWKERMSAQFFVCIYIGNRPLKREGRDFDRAGLSYSIGGLSREDRVRVTELIRELKDIGTDNSLPVPERYAMRSFIMSVILGQEFANADAIKLVNGLREGVES